MIYRIKIVNEGKFVRYATDEEMKYLRVNADGKVERMILLPAVGIFSGWVDVSETHEVEWGIVYDGMAICVNDIIHYRHEYVYIDPMRANEKIDKYHVAAYVITQDDTGEFMLKCFAIPEKHNVSNFVNNDIGRLNKLRFIGKDIKIIGNLNLNPELLGEK